MDSCANIRFKEIQEAIISYGMYSPFMKQMLNLWSVCNRIISNDWKDFVNGVLHTNPQLQWSTWFKEEPKIIEIK